jgi:hypothetical protein
MNPARSSDFTPIIDEGMAYLISIVDLFAVLLFLVTVRVSVIIEGGEDYPTPLAHGRYQSSAIFSIFQRSTRG